MKKVFLLTMAITFLALIGCTTTSVATYSQFGEEVNRVEKTPVDSGRFDVLGAVSMECADRAGASYVDIFKKAQEIYGAVDEVINIHIDYKNTLTLTQKTFSGDEVSQAAQVIMTGLAIKYHK